MYCKNCQRQYPFQEYFKEQWKSSWDWRKKEPQTFICPECGLKFERKGWRSVLYFILNLIIDAYIIKMLYSLVFYTEQSLVYVHSWSLWQILPMMLVVGVLCLLFIYILHTISPWYCLATHHQLEQTESEEEETTDVQTDPDKKTVAILGIIILSAVLLFFGYYSTNQITKEVTAAQAIPLGSWSKAHYFYQTNSTDLQKAADDMMRNSNLVMISSDLEMIIKEGYGDQAYKADSIDGSIWFVFANNLTPNNMSGLDDTTAFQLVKSKVFSHIYEQIDNAGHKIVHLVNYKTNNVEYGYDYLYSGTIDPKTTTFAYVVKPMDAHWYWYKSVDAHIQFF